ncbi:MAG: HAD-IIB family hydrolase [Clostridia bacterium]|nr:HAD-IIB family hydrolase [Clostridia bacterium]
MDFSSYLIVSDMDGTLLNRESCIPERSLDAIRRFVAGGGSFTVATGRPHVILDAIPTPEVLLTAPAILVNGAYLYDFRKGAALFEECIPAETAAELLAFAREDCEDIPFRVATLQTALRTATPYGLMLHDMEIYTDKNVRILPCGEWALDDWQKIVFRAEPEVLARVRAKAEMRFSDRLDIFLTGPRLLEMQVKGCSKAKGIDKLRGAMGIDNLTVIACGDFENDIEMLRAADIAVAPANAIEDVKTAADCVLCDCNDGLIADVIEKIEAGTLQKKA